MRQAEQSNSRSCAIEMAQLDQSNLNPYATDHTPEPPPTTQRPGFFAQMFWRKSVALSDEWYESRQNYYNQQFWKLLNSHEKWRKLNEKVSRGAAYPVEQKKKEKLDELLITKIGELVIEGADITCPDPRGYTVLHWAILNSHWALFNWILKSTERCQALGKVVLSTKMNGGQTPMRLLLNTSPQASPHSWDRYCLSYDPLEYPKSHSERIAKLAQSFPNKDAGDVAEYTEALQREMENIVRMVAASQRVTELWATLRANYRAELDKLNWSPFLDTNPFAYKWRADETKRAESEEKKQVMNAGLYFRTVADTIVLLLDAGAAGTEPSCLEGWLNMGRIVSNKRISPAEVDEIWLKIVQAFLKAGVDYRDLVNGKPILQAFVELKMWSTVVQFLDYIEVIEPLQLLFVFKKVVSAFFEKMDSAPPQTALLLRCIQQCIRHGILKNPDPQQHNLLIDRLKRSGNWPVEEEMVYKACHR